jgi:methionine synthase II (cobalamin-independent)
MTHQEVTELKHQIEALINHITERKIANAHLNYALDRNQENLISAVKIIDKHVSKELKDLEIKVWGIAREEYAKLTEEEKQVTKDLFGFGLKFVTEEERVRRLVLMDEYNKYMQDPNDFVIYRLNPVKLEDLPIEYQYYKILKKFLPEEVLGEESPEEVPIKTETKMRKI